LVQRDERDKSRLVASAEAVHQDGVVYVDLPCPSTVSARRTSVTSILVSGARCG
jgi:hypothetical protein